MSAKRRRVHPADPSATKHIKRTKFTIENAILPISKRGVVLVSGAGEVGQLGLGGDVLEKSRFSRVPGEYEITNVCAGGMHTACLTKEGIVLTYGCNDEGALGRVTSDQEDSEFTPGVVDLPSVVVQISAGDSHTAALLNDGRVFAWGTFRDSHGNMGLTIKGNEKLPYEIFSGTVVKIASGADHLVFLTSNGEIYTCGCGEQGQLGRTSHRGCNRDARNGAGIDQLGKLLTPLPISLKPTLKLHFEDIWAGTYSTFAKVAGKDQLYVFGLNNYNQLGLKAPDIQFSPKISLDFSKYRWKLICSAEHHAIGLDENGKVYAIGRKEYGRLGLGKNTEDASNLTLIPFLENKTVIHIGCGSATSFAVTDAGELFGWGMGTVGQLGTGAEDDCFEPTLISSKQLLDLKVFRVDSGGQHTVILAIPNNTTEGDSINTDAT